MSRIAALFVLAVTATPAFADPGHLLDQGHGHVHWDEFLIVAAIAAVLVRYGAARLARRARKA